MTVTTRDKIRLRMACRPLLGLLVRGQPIPPPPPPVRYLVTNPTTHLYWRNPWPHHHVATPEWGKREQAYRFHSRTYALDTMTEQGVTAIVVEDHVPAKTECL